MYFPYPMTSLTTQKAINPVRDGNVMRNFIDGNRVALKDFIAVNL